MPVELPPLPLNFIFSDVGEDGPEPSIGITSSGCIFFIAMEKPMRSCDHGQTWNNVADITQAPFTSDPYGWVDPVTDRVFNIHMIWKVTDMFNPHFHQFQSSLSKNNSAKSFLTTWLKKSYTLLRN